MNEKAAKHTETSDMENAPVEPDAEEASSEDAASDSRTASDPRSAESVVDSRAEMEELLRELRAEVTRLKVQQAKARTESWMQRHPGWTAVLSIGLGAAAGYGIAKWREPDPEPRLSDRARAGLKHLAEVARQTASEVSHDLEDRAARAGKEAREISRRLFEDAERASASAGKRAQAWSREATERAREQAQKLGEEASEQVRRAQEEGSKQAQELGSRIAEDVQRAEDELGRRAKETADRVRDSMTPNASTLRQSLVGLLSVVAGSVLAKKIRNWLA